ncbi:PKS-NRPS hybrid synthetase, partial [Golovinomyces cichoracearum]
MVNISGSAGNSMTPQLAVSFVSGEKEEDYKWVLNCTKQLLIKYNIPFPKVWVTDRELALMKAIEAIFPTSDHILCRWHVNMNVVARCKKYFKVQKEWDAFYTTWIKLIDSTTLEDVRKNFEVLCKHNNVA